MQGRRFRSSLAGSHILFLGDDSHQNRLTMKFLSQSAAQVQVTASLDEALERLNLQYFDVILADISLVGMEGHSLIQRLRSQSGGIRIPIIAILSSVQNARELLQIGYDACLTKPVGPFDLIETVAYIFRKNGSSHLSTPTVSRETKQHYAPPVEGLDLEKNSTFQN